jgi:aminopeptidase-like protein
MSLLPDDPLLAKRVRAQLERLYPLCRSMSGDGVRATLDVIGESVPLQRWGIASGTTCHDWTVNDEWNVRDAWIADASGRRVVDFREHTLHLVGYSVPVRERMTLEQLRPHLFTLPEHPDWIPYRTSYYERTWGFCLSQRQLDAMDEGPYDVVIDSDVGPGELTIGEVVVPGETADEVLVSAHTCHPSLVNDNLSGIVVATEVAAALAALPRRRLTYRFVFAPGVIGSLAWLTRHQEELHHVRHGLVLAGLGGPGPLVYKRSRRADRDIDRAASHVVGREGGEVRDYSPYGYDERQYNSLGFDLPVGRLTRTPHGEYPEYHTSADDLDFVKDEELVDAFSAIGRILDVLEHDAAYVNLSPYGEPQLGKRGLYPSLGGKEATDAMMALLWTMACSDGETRLLDIAERAGLDFAAVARAAGDLEAAELLARVTD